MSPRTPKYRFHKGSGQALVQLGGRRVYLGKFGTSGSKERYRQLVAEWLQRQAAHHPRQDILPAQASILSVNELILAYWEHAQAYYRKDGEPTGQLHGIRVALRFLRQLYGRTPAKDFGPRALKAVRQVMIEKGLSRSYINANIDRIRRAFRWAVSEELIPVAVYEALRTVSGLRAGRTAARETAPIQPVPLDHVNAILPYLSKQVAAMVKLQLACAARPGEVCRLRPCDITRGSDGIWTFTLPLHKTSHHGHERHICLGPKARAILSEWLDRPPEQFCFSPAEAVEARNARRRSQRRTPITPSQAKRRPKSDPQRRPGARYTKDSYATAIERACNKAGVPAWSPNQLRHTQATLIRERFGIQAAQTVLGHRDPKITTVYAQQSLQLAKEVMKEVG